MAKPETGGGGLGPVGAVLLTIVILAVARVLFNVDLIGYLDTAADWLADVLTDLIRRLGDGGRGDAG